jgi:hypothetical protein
LSALLKFRDPGRNTLRDTIHSTDPDLAFKAVSLAGQYRVADVTPDILSEDQTGHRFRDGLRRE